MSILYLTSHLDTNIKNDNGTRTAKHFGNKNQILDNLKNDIKKFDNFLFIFSDPNNIEMNKLYFDITVESFKKTLPFKNYNYLSSISDDTKALINDADFILLSGGHVPTQNNFFGKIKLDKLLLNKKDAVILGVSAGSMNMASIVYCPPELEGEAVDPTFNKFLRGLGLTDISIMPHRESTYTTPVDNKNIFDEYILPDSHKHIIYSLEDDSYIRISNDVATIYGEAYLVKNGIETKICETESSYTIK